MGIVRPTVTPTVLEALVRMIQQSPGRVSRRAQAVVWWLEGQRQTGISQRLGVSRQSVQAWCARFRQGGADALWDRPRSGRPLTAGLAALPLIAACLGGSDLAGTQGPGGWTVGRLVAAVAARGVQVSAQTVRRLLPRLDARWRRGQLVAPGDPARVSAVQRLAADLLDAMVAARQAGRRLLPLFEDEADLALLAHAGYSWQLPDQPALIPTPGHNQKLGLFGTLSLDGDLLITEAPRKTAVAFTAHLEHLVARHPDTELAIVLDNAGIHHARATRDWLAAHPSVHLLWLPRYSPNDNAQERVWSWLRADVCRNRAFPDLESKLAAARAFFADLTPEALCRRCVPERLLIGLLAEAFDAAGTR